MALTFSSGNYLSKGSGKQIVATIPAGGLTVAFWCHFTAFSGTGIGIIITDAGLNNCLDAYRNGTGIVTVESYLNPTDPIKSWGSALSTGVWHLVCVTWAAAGASRSISVDGGTFLTDSTSCAPTGFTNTFLGDDGGGHTWGGQMAHVGVWSAVLTQGDATQLFNRVSPRKVRPSALISLTRCQSGGSEPDLCSATKWTATGTPVVSAGPPIFCP